MMTRRTLQLGARALLLAGLLAAGTTVWAQGSGTTTAQEMRQIKQLYVVWLSQGGVAQQVTAGDSVPAVVAAEEMHDVKLAALAHRSALERAADAPLIYVHEMRDVKLAALAHRRGPDQLDDAGISYAQQMRQLKRIAVAYMSAHPSFDVVTARR